MCVRKVRELVATSHSRRCELRGFAGCAQAPINACIFPYPCFEESYLNNVIPGIFYIFIYGYTDAFLLLDIFLVIFTIDNAVRFAHSTLIVNVLWLCL